MKRTPPGAFSLVEVALALGVISFAILALLGLILTAQQSSRESVDATDNTLLFEKVINQLKLKPYSQAQLDVSESTEESNDDVRTSVFPLPALNKTVSRDAAEPFVVDEQYRYMGNASDATKRSAGSKVVLVVVKNSIDLELEGMHEPTEAQDGQLALVRVEIFSPAASFNPTELTAQNHQIFETEIGVLEQ